MFLKLLLFMQFYSYEAINCSWGYRFDSEYNHFNLVYPDRNAVYFGFIIPQETTNITITNSVSKKTDISTHPDASYFSVQIYNINDLVKPSYHWIDIDIMDNVNKLMDLHASYTKTMILDSKNSYFALFRIYNSFINKQPKKTEKNENNDTLYWSGMPPKTYINGDEYPLCDIQYDKRNMMYSNISNEINPGTGTICSTNNEFVFMVIPEGSLANSDANYMIACIKPNTKYRINVKMPQIMCSVGYTANEPSPWINETYDLRYASMNVESTMSPRPTVESYVIPCDVEDYELEVYVGNDVPFPGLLYRQMLPNPDCKYSIEHARQKCYKHADKKYDIACVKKQMGDYYPFLTIISVDN
jgi:hypothetical protein